MQLALGMRVRLAADPDLAGIVTGLLLTFLVLLLLYWGCGAKAGPGQPVVIDFAKVA